VSELVERFERIWRDNPGRLLIHVPATGASLTADDLWNAARAQRDTLDGLGIGDDHLIISAAGNRPAALALWIACRSLGSALMPVDAGTPATELGTLAERFGATIAILPRSVAGIEMLGQVSPFDDTLAAVRLTRITPAPAIYKGAAALKVTSGSTGLPKATFTRESQLVEDTMHVLAAMEIGPDDTQLATIPLSHAYGLGNLTMAVLLQGTPIVLRDAFVPQQVYADARQYGARVFPGVPFMFAHFANNPENIGWPRGLDKLVSAGAPLGAGTVRAFAGAFGVKIHSFYGTSETGGIAYDDSPDVDLVGTVGRALPGVTISLLPEEGAPVDGGRVHVTSSAVSSGYAGSAAASTDGFVNGGFLTGDYGHFDHRRHLILTGRSSSFINVAGRKVQPEEVEQVLRSMPGIDDVRIIGAADAARGQQILACIVSHDRGLTAQAVRAFCAARLAAYKVPRTIAWLDCIPLTERGKTDRAKLEAKVRDHLDRSAENGVL
jgi:acyl-CoA synthetase (AMP-forming)/AMP-acid ligase II